MQKRLIALSVLAASLLATAPVQAHTGKAQAKPTHTKHAQQKQLHASRAHPKHSKLAAATHKGAHRHHHQTQLAATTRIADFGMPAAIDAEDLKLDTAFVTTGPKATYLTAASGHAAAPAVAVPAWLG